MDMQATKEFLAELKVLTRVHHLNLVPILLYLKYLLVLIMLLWNCTIQARFIPRELLVISLIGSSWGKYGKISLCVI